MATATVMCKLPNGIRINHGKVKLQDGKPAISPVDGSVMVDGEKTVYLNGSSSEGAVGGFGMTPNVDLDWITDFLEVHKSDLPFVASGAIFVEGRIDTATAKARERKDMRFGLEPATTADFDALGEPKKAELEIAER